MAEKSEFRRYLVDIDSISASQLFTDCLVIGTGIAGLRAALEAAERGVRINAVVPTLAVHDFLTRVVEAEHLDAMAALQPQGRPAEPVEVANAIVFLASDLSGYLTGECISASAQKP